LYKGGITISELVKTVLRVSFHRFGTFWEQTVCALLQFLPAVCSVRLIMKEEPFKVTERAKLVDLLLSKSSSGTRNAATNRSNFRAQRPILIMAENSRHTC
jgi:hypothetical protein